MSTGPGVTRLYPIKCPAVGGAGEVGVSGNGEEAGLGFQKPFRGAGPVDGPLLR